MDKTFSGLSRPIRFKIMHIFGRSDHDWSRVWLTTGLHSTRLPGFKHCHRVIKSYYHLLRASAWISCYFTELPQNTQYLRQKWYGYQLPMNLPFVKKLFLEILKLLWINIQGVSKRMGIYKCEILFYFLSFLNTKTT